MPAQTPVWIGSTAITETADSPQLMRDATRFRVKRVFEGPYATLSGNQPTKGSAMSDLPAACLIVDVLLTKMPGGKGRLEVTAETQGPSDTDPDAPTYEVEWVEVDRAIEEHSIFDDGTTSGTTPGRYALQPADRAAVQRWQEEDDFNLRQLFQFKIQQDSVSAAAPPTGYSAPRATTINGVAYNVYTLSTNAQVLAKKILRGTTQFRTRCPVVRESIESFTLPATNPCDVVEAPPSAASPPAGYIYVRSAQRGVKTGRYGKWKQEQEWEGATWVDPDLYPNA